MGTSMPETGPRATLNPRHALWIRDRILAAYVPGGFWAVKVRAVADRWLVFAVPRRNTVGEPFLIGHADTRNAALVAGIAWQDCATVIVLRLDRIVFAGIGDATLETVPDFDPATLLAAEVAA